MTDVSKLSQLSLTAVEFVTLVQTVVVPIAEPVSGHAAPITTPVLPGHITHCKHTISYTQIK